MKLVFIFFNIILGASIGSFLNVVAARTIDGIPWWGKERSKCPECSHPLRFFDLIPVLSFIFLRGKCRYCETSIKSRYFIAETTGALIGGLLSWRWGITSAATLSLVTAYILLLNSLTDLYSGYIYDFFALSMGVFGLAFRLFGGLVPFLDGCMGAIVGIAIIGIIILVSRGGMGWGDASLMAGLGGALGLRMASVALYLGFMTGGVIAIALLALKIVKRKDAIPLGPFLAFGGLAAMLFGPYILGFLGMAPSWPWY